MRILLFCNQGYGRAFEAAFRAWCRDRGEHDLLVVHSLRGMLPSGVSARSSVRSLAARARVAALNQVGRLTAARIMRVEDVNSEAFSKGVLGGPVRPHGIVAGFNQIFSAATIEQFAGLYNFHPSLLPYYRGPVPSYWCILNGEKRTGITLHEVQPRIDAGRILWQREIPIATSNPEELDRALSIHGAAFLPRLLDSLRDGTTLPEERVAADEVYRQRVDYRSFPP